MDRVIVIGIYEFIGFHLCQHFLEEGIEVIGIHIPTDDRDQFFDEKRLLIGRNANFHEEDESYLSALSDHAEGSFTFIDYYSFYMKREEERVMKVVETLSWIEESHTVTFLMPVQLYEDSETFNHHFAFYLPTIYGPWQPSSFSFHQALCHSESIVLDEREWTEDAIYIDDTIQMIVNYWKSQHKSIWLKSNVKDQWKNIMTMLKNNPTFQHQDEKLSVRENITILEVDGMDPREGIERQKSHMSQINK